MAHEAQVADPEPDAAAEGASPSTEDFAHLGHALGGPRTTKADMDEVVEAQFEPSGAWKQAHEDLRKAIEGVEAVTGGKISQIIVYPEGLEIRMATSEEGMEQFEVAGGWKPRN